MGQYYKAIILEDNKKTINAFACPSDYDNSDKLMGHSFIGNNFVARIEAMLEGNPQYLVWAGDYANAEKDKNGNDRKCEKGHDLNLYKLAAGEDKKKFSHKEISASKHCRYIVNHTKKVFVDKKSVKEFEKDWAIHPLPLLTAEGNGKGGGDYLGSLEDNVGSWARDKISIEVSMDDYDYEETTFAFVCAF